MHENAMEVYLFPNTFDIAQPCKNHQFDYNSFFVTQYYPRIYETNSAYYFEAHTMYHFIFNSAPDSLSSPITGEIWDSSFYVCIISVH
jgi:hypothetical protein